MRLYIYNILVNQHVGIQYRYHQMHDNAGKSKKILSWVYLLWLNFAYYVLQIHSLGDKPVFKTYEERALLIKESESSYYLNNNPEIKVDKMVAKLLEYDVISFDVFDTLIYRPFSDPTDLFYLVGEKLHYLDFREVRRGVEYKARQICKEKNAHMEVSFDEIWDLMEKETGIDKETGMKAELDLELEFCYANPFMLEVWKRIINAGKKVVITSDMYLPAAFIEKILDKNGYCGAKKIYVSNEYRKNKASGELYEIEKKDFPGNSIIHIGDNSRSDWDNAKKHGFSIYPYKSSLYMGMPSRPSDMSALVGSAYRGLVCHHLYNGLKSFSMEYEYGYIYGGLFLVGYCHFIHDYCLKNSVDKILFLSRDGDILKQSYDYLYQDENTEYVYASRKAMTKLMADYDRRDFFRRFIYHKTNQNYKIIDVFKSMELETLLAGGDSTLSERLFEEDDILTDKNCDIVKEYIEKHWDTVLGLYASQNDAAKKYYSSILEGSRHAVAVDIGWAGSGALSLSYLVERVWKIPCEITGIVAGTNTLHLPDADASEPFFQSGKLVSYMYSAMHNRDLYKLHNPSAGFAVFWEQLLASTKRQFSGFANQKIETSTTDDREYVYDSHLDLTYKFGKKDYNIPGIEEIQYGIMDFARQYKEHFGNCPFMFNISGRDAYAPMVVAATNNAAYLKAVNKRFDIDINVD